MKRLLAVAALTLSLFVFSGFASAEGLPTQHTPVYSTMGLPTQH